MNGFAIQLRTAQVVMDRFPEKSQKILQLYRTVDHIRQICDDMALAIETLERFKSKSDRDNSAEIADFQEVIEKLNHELIEIVDAQGSG
jgi:hypothetical protein